MDTKQSKRSAFSGKIGFVLSAAGASVGLGNIWRFPYLAAKYGGGIFLLVYIVLAVTFGYTMIMAETALGRMTRKSPVGAFAAFGKKGGLRFGGWINAVIPIQMCIRDRCCRPPMARWICWLWGASAPPRGFPLSPPAARC